jgi:DNA-binding GntR family transcriptional regulator
LQKLPGYGAYVKIPDRREIEEFLVVRELMEVYTVAEAARRADEKQIGELRKNCDEIHKLAKRAKKSGATEEIVSRLIELDLAFHTRLYELADNRQIIRIMENSRILSAIFCTYEKDFFTLGEISHIWREHCRILRAIERRDPQQACYWLKLQIQRSRQLHNSGYEKLMQNPKFRELRELSKISTSAV